MGRPGRPRKLLPRDGGGDPPVLLNSALPVEPSNAKPYRHYVAESKNHRSPHEVPRRQAPHDHDPTYVRSVVEKVQLEMRTKLRSGDVFGGGAHRREDV